MGAFAGSAALLCRVLRPDISVVTLTMNNSCNLKCPHCYLQYAESDGYLAQYVVDAIAKSSAEAVAIVGMEPLKSRRSAAELASIVRKVKAAGKKVGVVTNGLNAHLMDEVTARSLDWLDVSVDGDRTTYQAIRGAPVGKLELGITRFRELGVSQINVLHTLHANNLDRLADLVDFGRELASGHVVLSPFSATRHQGIQPGELSITPQSLLSALSVASCDLTDCWVVLDLDWLQDECERNEFASRIEEQLAGRTVIFRADPAAYGMIRITYDARLMTPRQAMHTSDYRHRSKPLGQQELELALSSPGLTSTLM